MFSGYNKCETGTTRTGNWQEELALKDLTGCVFRNHAPHGVVAKGVSARRGWGGGSFNRGPKPKQAEFRGSNARRVACVQRAVIDLEFD